MIVPEPELDITLCHFFFRKREKVSAWIMNRIRSNEALTDTSGKNGKLYSIVTDKMFERSRETLEAQRKERRRSGKGRGPKKALRLNEEEVENL